MSLLLDNGLSRLQSARRATLMVIADVPEDRWCHQPAPGMNHTMWSIGHITLTDDFFLTQLAGEPSRFSEEWHRCFTIGSFPQPSLDAYPSPAQVKTRLAEQRQALTDWFSALSDDRLAAPLTDPLLQRFGNNLADLMPSIAWHEGWHAGQASVARKSLGLPSLFGG